ncbi:hypothetical protein ACFVMC_03525 [Nocardia sp. NPDC127579]|uniref:hypothetical protein n=1 Tax=Nocardia sp. NPDC127579 TaxID=3345402 RepID=UPI003625C1F6
MNQDSGDTRRTRRRAGRPAGPPVEKTGAGEVTVPSAAVVEGGAEPVDAVADTAPSADTVRVSTEKPAAKTVDAETASADTVQAETSAEADTVKADTVAAVDTVKAETAAEADTVEVALSKTSAAEQPTAKAAVIPAAADFVTRRTDPGPLSTGRIVALAASAVLVLALVAAAGFSFYLVHGNSVREDRRTEYVQAARQAVLNLTTIRADSAKEDVDRILSTASGKFKTEFDGRVDPFLEIVQQAKVASTGEIVEAALVSDDADSAIVLVAAKQTLTNAGSNEPQTRFYRFRITVDRTDSGMSASNVEFVA